MSGDAPDPEPEAPDDAPAKAPDRRAASSCSLMLVLLTAFVIGPIIVAIVTIGSLFASLP